MKLLYVSIHYPLPPTNGAEMRLWSILRALTHLGHDVSLVTFAKDAPNSGNTAGLSVLTRDHDIVPRSVATFSEGNAYFKRLVCAFSRKPFFLSRFQSSAMRAILRRRLRQDYDVVICDGILASANLPDSDVPLVMSSHNADHVILQRYAAVERNPLKALYAKLEAQKVRTSEAALCRRSMLVIACSEHDAELFRKMAPDVPVHVMPNVVDADQYPISSEEEPHTIVHLGAMDWYPNRDSVSYFAREILPLIRQEIPDARLIVAGRSPSEAFRASFKRISAVEFTGTVEDMRPILARAAVMVVPLRIGSGTRLKIVEGAVMAKPIVSTSVGVEGLDFRHGEEILIADDPGQFAGYVVNLLRDPRRRTSLGRAARQRSCELYGMSALNDSLAVVMDHVRRLIVTG